MFNIGKKIQRKKRKLFSFLLIKINKIFPSLYTLLKIEIEKKNYRKILNKKIIKPRHVKNLEKINSYEFKITSHVSLTICGESDGQYVKFNLLIIDKSK